MACTVDLGPLVRLQKQLWRGAFFTGLGVYLEAILAFVLATEQSLSPRGGCHHRRDPDRATDSHLPPSQVASARRLVRRYWIYLALVGAFVLVVSFGSPAGQARVVATVMAIFVTSLTAWAPVLSIRAARLLGPQLRDVRDDTVLMESLSFNLSDSIATRLRVFGGDRSRWMVPAAGAVVAFVGVVVTLSALLRAMGLRPASPVAQAATLAAMFVFYIGMRRMKLSATQLRARDRRAPVLILRQFGDDFLESGKMSLGGAPTFEHFVAAEINRIGPVVAIGRPGERLQPLGASRDYLDRQ